MREVCGSLYYAPMYINVSQLIELESNLFYLEEI